MLSQHAVTATGYTFELNLSFRRQGTYRLLVSSLFICIRLRASEAAVFDTAACASSGLNLSAAWVGY